MTLLWWAQQATIEIGAAIAVVNAATTLDTQHAGTDYSGEIKDLRITGGDRDVESVKLFGYNELLDERRAVVNEASFTLIHQDVDTGVFLMGAKQAVGATGYNRCTGGEKATNDRASLGVLFKLTDGTNHVVLLLNKAKFTTRELSLAADGHMEETLTCKCLASNYYEEDDY